LNPNSRIRESIFSTHSKCGKTVLRSRLKNLFATVSAQSGHRDRLNQCPLLDPKLERRFPELAVNDPDVAGLREIGRTPRSTTRDKPSSTRLRAIEAKSPRSISRSTVTGARGRSASTSVECR